MMDTHTIVAAFRAWLKQATGFDDAHVIKANQSGNNPSGPYATVQVVSGGGVGMPATTWDVVPGAPAGQEVAITLSSLNAYVCRVGMYSPSTVSNQSGFTLLENARQLLDMPSVRDALRAAGIAINDTGTVLDLSALRLTEFEGRAALDVRFTVSASNSERTGYIARVQGSGTVSDEHPTPVTIPLDVTTQ